MTGEWPVATLIYVDHAICYRPSVCLSITRMDQSKRLELGFFAIVSLQQPHPSSVSRVSFVQKF